jgi:hypothetical protein
MSVAINWKHILLTAAGAAIPVLFAALDSAGAFNLHTLEQAALTAGAVFWATAVKSWMPSSGAQA